MRDLRNDIGRKGAVIKIRTESDNAGTKAAQIQVARLDQVASAAATKIAVVHRNLQELGKGTTTGLRLDTRDVEAGLSRVRAGVLRYQKEFSSKVGIGDILGQVTQLEKFFSGQGIKADAFNRVVPELKRVLELQQHIQANREINFEIHVNRNGVADIKNIGVTLDGLERQVNELNLKRRQLAEQLRTSGTVASVVGGKNDPSLRNINVAPLVEYQAILEKIRARGAVALLPMIEAVGTLDARLDLAREKLAGLTKPTKAGGVQLESIEAVNLKLKEQADILRANAAESARLAANDAAVFRRNLADNIRSSGTIASVIGGEKNINADLFRRPNLVPNTLGATGSPSRPITREALNDLARYDDLIATARQQTIKFEEELLKSAGIAGKTIAAFEKVGTSVAGRMEAASNAPANLGKFGSIIEGVTQRANQLKNTIARWAIGYTIVSQLIGFMGMAKSAIIDFNEQLDRSRIAFTTFLGSSDQADKFLSKLRDFAKVTPYTFSGLIPLTQQMVALGLVSKSEVQGKAIPALRAIGDASAALGKGDEGIRRIVLALGQMTQKGKASAEEVTRQLAEVGVNGAKYIAQAMGVTVPKVFELMKKGAIDGKKAANAILEGIGSDPMFAGLMDKQARTFEGALSNIQDAVTDLFSRGFRPLYDEIARTAQELAAWANSDDAEQMAKRLAARVQSAIIQLKALYQILTEMKAPAEGLAVAIGLIFAADKINGLMKGIALLREFRTLMIAGSATEAAGIALPELAPALAPLLALATNPVVLAILAGTILIGGIVLWKKWQNTVAETTRVTKELGVISQQTTDSLNGLSSVGAVSEKAAKSIAFVRQQVEQAGKDPKKLGDALTAVSRAEYNIKKLKRWPSS